MRKHTKGKWEIVKSDWDGELSIQVKSHDGTCFEIAREVGGQVYKDADGNWSDRSEVEANARLLKAAPQQHDALLAVLYAPGFEGLDDATKNAVRAAIAVVEEQ